VFVCYYSWLCPVFDEHSMTEVTGRFDVLLDLVSAGLTVANLQGQFVSNRGTCVCGRLPSLTIAWVEYLI